jgi:hypothetical protein
MKKNYIIPNIEVIAIQTRVMQGLADPSDHTGGGSGSHAPEKPTKVF